MDSSPSENTTTSPSHHENSSEIPHLDGSDVSQSSSSPSNNSIPQSDQPHYSGNASSSDLQNMGSNANDPSTQDQPDLDSQNAPSRSSAPDSDSQSSVNPGNLSLSNNNQDPNSSFDNNDSSNPSSSQSHSRKDQLLSQEENRKNIDSLVSQSEAADDTIQALQEQFKYYFSDCNIFRDSHFRDQILSDPDEWVPLSFFLTWHRVKNLSTHIADLVKACSQVPDFEIDASDVNSPLIRRKQPYPLTHKTAEKTCYVVII